MSLRRADAVALPGSREGYHLMADQDSLRELGYPSRGSLSCLQLGWPESIILTAHLGIQA